MIQWKCAQCPFPFALCIKYVGSILNSLPTGRQAQSLSAEQTSPGRIPQSSFKISPSPFLLILALNGQGELFDG
jgi:hypothetical protein